MATVRWSRVSLPPPHRAHTAGVHSIVESIATAQQLSCAHGALPPA